jgi:glucan phosphorylase
MVDFATLYDQYLQPDWRERYPDPKTWDLSQDIPDQELWEAHRRRKRRLIAFVRERMVKFALDRKAGAAEIRRLRRYSTQRHLRSASRDVLRRTSARRCCSAMSTG